MITRLLILLLAVVLWTGPAHADPITGAIAAAVTWIGAHATAFIGLALSVGASLLKQAFATKPKSGVKLEVEMGEDRPISACIGHYATAGRRKYIGTFALGDTPNAMLVEVIELGNIPAPGQPALWVGEDLATIHWDVTTDYGHPVSGIFDNENATTGKVKGKHWLMWLQYFDGTQTAASDYLVGRFGGAERPWTSDMVGRGVPYVVMTYQYNQSYQSSLPSLLFEMPSIPLYDPRADSSVGGAGSVRWSDKAGWTASNNLAVIAYNLARGIRHDGAAGAEYLFGGQGLAASRLPASSWIAAMNAADMAVAADDSTTEPAYRGGYELDGDTSGLDVLTELGKGLSATLAEVGGALKIRVGAPGVPVMYITDADIVVTDEQSLAPFPTLDETYNGAEATYPLPSDRWQSHDAPGRHDADLEAADGGRRLTASLQYPAVPYPNQVQRLMTAALKAHRRFRTHQITLPPIAWLLEPGDVIAWTSARNGYDAVRFEVVEITGRPTMCQVATLREVDPSDHDWSPSEALPESTGSVGSVLVPVQSVFGWSVEAAVVADQDGRPRSPAIRVAVTAGMEDVASIRLRVRDAAGVIVYDAGGLPYDPDAEAAAWIVTGSWCLPSTPYEVSGTLEPYTVREVAWSAWTPVTTVSVKIPLDDLADEVRTSIATLDDWITADLAGTVGDLATDVAALGGDVVVSQARDLRAIRAELQAVTGGAADTALGAFVERMRALGAEASATSRMDAYVALTDDRLDVLASDVTTLQATVPGLATSSAVSALTARVAVTEAGVSSLSSALTALSATVDGKASTTALNALSTTVSDQGGVVTSLSSALTALTATVDDATADARFRMEAVAGPAGYARLGMYAAYTTGGTPRAAGLYLDVPADTSAPARVVVQADQFAIVGTGASPTVPFAVDTAGVYIDSALIRSITTDQITFNDGSIQTSALANNAVGARYVVVDDTLLAVPKTTTNQITTLMSFVVPEKEESDFVEITVSIEFLTYPYTYFDGNAPGIRLYVFDGTTQIIQKFLVDVINYETTSYQTITYFYSSGTASKTFTIKTQSYQAGVKVTRRAYVVKIDKKSNA